MYRVFARDGSKLRLALLGLVARGRQARPAVSACSGEARKSDNARPLHIEPCWLIEEIRCESVQVHARKGCDSDGNEVKTKSKIDVSSGTGGHTVFP